MIAVRTFNQQDYPDVKRIYQQGIDTGNATFQSVLIVLLIVPPTFMEGRCLLN
jgi:L-amino acid N-acyltransferase YncA